MNNREIKFRAFVHPLEGELNEDEKPQMIYDLAFEDYEPLNYILKKVKRLMQYTGLKDINGKEIYEGDLISNINITFEIFWDKSLCAFRCRRPDANDKFLSEIPITTKYWVSGNIYESVWCDWK